MGCRGLPVHVAMWPPSYSQISIVLHNTTLRLPLLQAPVASVRDDVPAGEWNFT